MNTVTFIVAILIAVLSGLGVGGGGLFVIFLSFFTQLDHLEIQGINLAFFIFSSASALAVHVFKRKIFVGAVLIMSVSGIIGALIGTFLSGNISPLILRKLFGAMLVLSGMLSLKKAFAKRHDNLHNKQR